MRGRGQEQPVLETVHQATNGLRELAVDCITRAAGWCGVMRPVEDQQRAWPERTEKVPQPGDISLIGQQVVRDDEARAGEPRIDAEASQPTQLHEALPIDDREGQPELGLELVLPLQRHRWRRRNDREVDTAPQQQLAQDQSGFDRLAEADIVGDQQVDARQPERLAQRQQLIGFEPDAGAERRLQQLAVRRGRRVPFQRPQIRGENRGAVAPEARPEIIFQTPSADLRLPRDLQRLSLRVVRDARKLQCREALPLVVDALDQPRPAADFDEITYLGCAAGGGVHSFEVEAAQ